VLKLVKEIKAPIPLAFSSNRYRLLTLIAYQWEVWEDFEAPRFNCRNSSFRTQVCVKRPFKVKQNFFCPPKRSFKVNLSKSSSVSNFLL